MPVKSAKRAPKARGERPAGDGGKKRSGKRRLGLAGRVALIAICAAIVATLAQWIATPIMAQGELRYQQSIAASSGANLLADVSTLHVKAGHWDEIDQLVGALSDGLPQGQSAVFDANWNLVAKDGSPHALPNIASLKPLLQDPKAILIAGDRVYAARPIGGDQVMGYAVFSFRPRSALAIWSAIVVLNALVLVLALAVIAPFLIPIARRALKPVTDLERSIRKRDAKDKSKLADSSDDRLLKPLLTAVDEVNDRSEAAMRRALTMAYMDPTTRLPNRLRFVSKLDAAVVPGQAIALIVADIDRFRQVNVSYGPRIADLVLAAVAARLRATLSQSSITSFFMPAPVSVKSSCSSPWPNSPTMKRRSRRATSSPITGSPILSSVRWIVRCRYRGSLVPRQCERSRASARCSRPRRGT